MSTVLITGGNRGIGLAFVEACLSRRWRVIVAIRGDGAGRLRELQRDHGDRVELARLDLERFESIDALGERYRGVPIDLLISNAALTGGPLGTFGEMDYERFERCLRANTMAPFRLAERLADSVALSERRTMFFVGSRLGAHPFFGYSAYVISKTALNQVVKQVSLALAPRGVTAVAAHPGWVATDAVAEHGQAPLTPAASVAMLMQVIDRLTPELTGRFFDPDGTELPLVTQQTEPRFYGKPRGATR